MDKNDLLKVLMLAVTLIYVVSPVDAAPGPIDDAIAVVLSIIATKKLSGPGNLRKQ